MIISGARLLWDGVSFLELSVPARMRGDMCGLCGNFNGDKRDDFIGRRGDLLSSGQVSVSFSGQGRIIPFPVTGVRQLVARGREEGVLGAPPGRAPAPALLQGRLGGQHQVGQALRRHQELALRRLSLRSPAAILLQSLPHRYVRVSWHTVSLRGEND